MSHDHNHTKSEYINKAYTIGIVLNLVYVFTQILFGLKVNSLALLSDAGHNFLDVVSLALSMLSFKLAKAQETEKYTYGYKKASIMVSMINAVALLVSVCIIGYQAVLRFQHPEPLPGLSIAIVAGVGIVINGVSAFLFLRNKDEDINIKSAFLHLASDAVVSLGMVIGGIIIYYTHQYWLDPLISLIISLVIISSTWSLLKDSLRLSLDGVPDNVDFNKVKEAALSIKGVKDFHHIHIWPMSTTQNALTGHLVLDNSLSIEEIQSVKELLKNDLLSLNIHHATIETES